MLCLTHEMLLLARLGISFKRKEKKKHVYCFIIKVFIRLVLPHLPFQHQVFLYVHKCPTMKELISLCQDMSRDVKKVWQDMSGYVKICQDMSRHFKIWHLLNIFDLRPCDLLVLLHTEDEPQTLEERSLPPWAGSFSCVSWSIATSNLAKRPLTLASPSSNTWSKLEPVCVNSESETGTSYGRPDGKCTCQAISRFEKLGEHLLRQCDFASVLADHIGNLFIVHCSSWPGFILEYSHKQIGVGI